MSSSTHTGLPPTHSRVPGRPFLEHDPPGKLSGLQAAIAIVEEFIQVSITNMIKNKIDINFFFMTGSFPNKLLEISEV